MGNKIIQCVITIVSEIQCALKTFSSSLNAKCQKFPDGFMPTWYLHQESKKIQNNIHRLHHVTANHNPLKHLWHFQFPYMGVDFYFVDKLSFKINYFLTKRNVYELWSSQLWEHHFLTWGWLLPGSQTSSYYRPLSVLLWLWRLN